MKSTKIASWAIASSFLVSVGALADSDQFKIIDRQEFTVDINIDKAISCTYVPPGDFRTEGFVVSLDSSKVDFGAVDKNEHLPLYGWRYNIDIMPRGKDCRILEDLRALSTNGILTVKGERTIRKEVYIDQTCTKRFIATTSLNLPLDLPMDESYMMQLEKGDDACDLEAPLKETGSVKLHLQADQVGLKCAQEGDNFFRLITNPSTSTLSKPEVLVSEQKFTSANACELTRRVYLNKSRENDPTNLGETFEATRSIKDETVWGKLVTTQTLSVRIYDQIFTGIDHIVIR
jgi:hypothetical protein